MEHRFIPAGARKVADKQSSGVAYVYERNGRFLAVGYRGKANKPAWHYQFRTESARNSHVAAHFTRCRENEAYKANSQAESKRRDAELQAEVVVGSIFRASWGYEQTNVDFYEVTARSGSMVTVRKIASEAFETSAMSGKCAPLPGQFIGEPKRYRLQGDRIRIESYSSAFLMRPKLVAGFAVYDSTYFSTYA